MKRLIILLATLLPLSAIAQTSTFESLFKEYSTKEGCTTINISNAMLKSMEVNIDAEYMQVISVDNEAFIPLFQAQALEALKGFEVIMSVNSGGNTVEIRQHSNDKGDIIDIYIMTCSGDDCVLMHIIGKKLELGNIGSIINNVINI